MLRNEFHEGRQWCVAQLGGASQRDFILAIEFESLVSGFSARYYDFDESRGTVGPCDDSVLELCPIDFV